MLDGMVDGIQDEGIGDGLGVQFTGTTLYDDGITTLEGKKDGHSLSGVYEMYLVI